MRGRRGTASIVASPVLVGAVTTLIVIVSVFLAYNANQGLPFVPTYDLSVEVPNAANLVKGNEVRVGGFRVGLIDKINTRSTDLGDRRRSIAVLDLKLDKIIEPLSKDTQVLIRTRSALGLKYIELRPGQSKEAFAPGDTVRVANSSRPVEFDDFLNTFDQGLRDNSRSALSGFGDAVAGRGPAVNLAIQELPSFFTRLRSVMDVLNDSDTGLNQFFRQIGRTSAQVAPVAKVQAELFENMADTFEAFSRDPEALRQTIEKTPPTLDAAVRSFRVQRPFLADFADLSRRLRPAARELPRSLPAINRALVLGQEVLPETVALNRRTETVFRALDELASSPNTLLGLKDLTATVTVTAPLLEFVTPYQTVCNFANYFIAPLGNHFGQQLANGAGQRALNNSDNGSQDNRLGTSEGDRPADIPINEDPQKARAQRGPLQAVHGQAYAPAIDAQGNADCQNGQTGYIDNLNSGRYKPASDGNTNGQTDGSDFDLTKSGGSHVVGDADTPGLAGPTFKARDLGIDNLNDVDKSLRPTHGLAVPK